MEDWKERVAEEHKELCQKIEAIDNWINDPKNESKVNDDYIMLLSTQHSSMKTYASILEIRMSKYNISYLKI